jgi:hypothetical protein
MLQNINRDFSIALEQSETDTLLSRLTAIGEIPENPFGVSIRRFGWDRQVNHG